MLYLVILALAIILLTLLFDDTGQTKALTYSDIIDYFRNSEVKTFVVKENELTLELYNEEIIKYEIPYLSLFIEQVTQIMEEQESSGARTVQKYNYIPPAETPWWASFIPYILLFGVVVVLWYFMMRQASGGGKAMSFGRAKTKIQTDSKKKITFADVAGADEEKEELREIVDFLKNPKRYTEIGARVPKGVLLVGPPGTGKTYLAKAVAGEAEVPFLSISGSDFVEMYVGVGASRVRDLFDQAKRNQPSIVFIDEIDAVGRQRGAGLGGGHDEREQTLNAILVEMDGFESNDQVIVIAATNRADVLDPALVRPGRFDRQVYVPLPDVKGRFEILRVHARKVKMQTPVDTKLQRLARATPMFSGADLAAIINESALLATLAGKDAIDMDDLEEARDKVRWGRAKRSRVVEEKDREMTAYHEAGHAVVQTLLKDADPVHKVSIIPRGPYGGATFSLPEKDRQNYNRSHVEATLRVLCAGRLAEELVGHDTNSGAAADIRQATMMARHMVTEWGMSDRVGFVYCGDEPLSTRTAPDFSLGGKDLSPRTAEIIDEETKRIIDEAYADTRRILAENRDKLEAVARALLKYETLDGEEVRALVNGESLNRPTVADLISAEQNRRLEAPLARPVTHRPQAGEEPGPIPTPA